MQPCNNPIAKYSRKKKKAECQNSKFYGLLTCPVTMTFSSVPRCPWQSLDSDPGRYDSQRPADWETGELVWSLIAKELVKNNEMTMDSNSNPHKEIKNTTEGNCIGKYKMQYKCIFVWKSFLLLSVLKGNYINP